MGLKVNMRYIRNYRRARALACHTRMASGFPSPCLAHSNDRGGQAPALRVSRPPVPRHVSRNPTIAGETRSDARVASEGPRATVKKRFLLTVGRGPVPRHALSGRRDILVPICLKIETRRALLPAGIETGRALLPHKEIPVTSSAN